MRVAGELFAQETGFQVFLLGALVETAALMRFPQLPLLAVDPFASIAAVLFRLNIGQCSQYIPHTPKLVAKSCTSIGMSGDIISAFPLGYRHLSFSTLF